METKAKIIMALLAALGFVGCDIFGRKMEYGSPHAEYEIKGKVTDNENPLEGIRVVLKHSPDDEYEIKEAMTDTKGDYKIVVADYGTFNHIAVMAEDIDGDANGGEFVSQTVEETFSSEDYSGGSGEWYIGKAVKTIDFALELKMKPDDEAGE